MDLEKEVIGGIVLCEEKQDTRIHSVVYEVLEEKDFTNSFYRNVFKAYLKLITNDEIADFRNLYLKNKHFQDEMPVVDFVGKLVNEAPMPFLTRSLIYRLKEKSLLRQFKDLTAKEVKGEDVQEQIQEMLKRLIDFQSKIDSLKIDPVDIISVSIRAEAEDKSDGYKTGFKLIDEYTKGFKKGHFWVIAAYTNVGKTTLACQMAKNSCEQGAIVSFYSIEMSDTEIYDKLKWISENTKKDDVLKYKLNIITKKTSIEQIKADFESREPPEIIFVDYLQLMDFRRGESEYEAMTRISKEMQKIALKNNICIVALSQISNEGASTKNLDVIKLKGSGQIAASADKVLLLQRNVQDELESQGGFIENEARIILRKNRQGKKCVQSLIFNTDNGIFFQK